MKFLLLLPVLMGWLILAPAGGEGVTFPFTVYHEFSFPGNHGVPSGWLGDYRDILMDIASPENPFVGKTCMKITYTAAGSRKAFWAGIMWQYPANNDGRIDAGLNFTGARKLVFHARGEKGGEFINAFKFGGALGTYPDSDSAAIYNIVLTPEWQRYEIDLTHSNLYYISSFFTWVASKYNNPEGMTFYLDEIRIENT